MRLRRGEWEILRFEKIPSRESLPRFSGGQGWVKINNRIPIYENKSSQDLRKERSASGGI
jgi:hypothetical protein